MPDTQALTAETAFGGGPAQIGIGRRLRALMSADKLLWLFTAMLVIGIAIVPLVYTIDAAFFKETRLGLSNERSLEAIINVYTGGEYLGYLMKALMLAGTITALSLTLGVTMALLVGRTDLPGKPAFEFMIIMPLFMSPFTGLMAWVALGSQKSGFINVMLGSVVSAFGFTPSPLVNIWTYAGIVWIMFLFFCPYAFLFTIGNLRQMDSSLEEAARTTGATPMQTLFRVTLPLAIPAILAAGLLIFILSAELYTVPGMIGSQIGFTTLPWKIYKDSTAFPIHLAHAAAAGTMLLWVTVFGIWLQRRITRQSERFVTVNGKGFKARPLPLGKLKPFAVALICFYLASAVVLPYSALFLSSFMPYSTADITLDMFTVKHFVAFFSLQNTQNALWNTIWLALSAGTICVTLGALVSFMELRRRGPATKLLAFLGVLPIAVPGLIYGVGLLWTFLRTPLYGTAWVLLLAFVAKFLPYGIVVSRSGILQLHPELEQSARMSGADGLTALRKITLPLLKPTLIGIMFFVMLASMKELSASVLLYTQRSQVLSVLTWSYMDSGSYQFAAAIGVVQTIIMASLIYLVRKLFGVKLEKTFSRG